MAIFEEFTKRNRQRLSSPSEFSRIVDENGEPQVKRLPDAALDYSIPADQHHVLGIAIVFEDVRQEGFAVNEVNIDPSTKIKPTIIGTLNGQRIDIYVRAAMYPAEPEMEVEAINVAEDKGVDTYFAPVGLMLAGEEEGFFFVNYRGCEPL